VEVVGPEVVVEVASIVPGEGADVEAGGSLEVVPQPARARASDVASRDVFIIPRLLSGHERYGREPVVMGMLMACSSAQYPVELEHDAIPLIAIWSSVFVAEFSRDHGPPSRVAVRVPT